MGYNPNIISTQYTLSVNQEVTQQLMVAYNYKMVYSEVMKDTYCALHQCLVYE